MSDYDSDLLLWSERQAVLLRRMGAGERVNDQVDWENVAEEIESLGRSDKRELRSRIRTILLHLMKLQASPAADPRAGWRQRIMRERVECAVVLDESPSLRSAVPTIIAEELPRASGLAMAALKDQGEQPRVDPSTLVFTADQVFGPWLPA